MELTAIIEQGENGWLVGQIEEIPAVVAQGRTVEEVRSSLLNSLNLLNALNLLPKQGPPTAPDYTGRTIIREALHVAG
ncbi:MAG: hypothetical protein H7Z21_08395 [Hymenobacter sp.]|nr:hypothetical protein [Hymenobacter sp.]